MNRDEYFASFYCAHCNVYSIIFSTMFICHEGEKGSTSTSRKVSLSVMHHFSDIMNPGVEPLSVCLHLHKVYYCILQPKRVLVLSSDSEVCVLPFFVVLH